MCQINFTISASSVLSNNITSAQGRYKLTTEAVTTNTWVTPFNIPNISSAQTPDITTEGLYDLSVRVLDNQNIYSDWFNVSGGFKIGDCVPNEVPLINITASSNPITLPINQTTLQATASDTDGAIVHYLWTKISGGTATITATNTANTNVTGMQAGAYVFRCTVTDDDGATAFSEITINVAAGVTYYNTQQSGSAYRNNCSVFHSGGPVTYVVAAGTYSSIISQADADQQAINDVIANRQAYANIHGNCINCLTQGTLITLPDGSQELIENLNVGDEIYSVEIEGLEVSQTREEEFLWSSVALNTTPSTTKIINIVESISEEIYSLNNGLLEATSSHLHLVYRNDQWKIREFNSIELGDKIIDKEGVIIIVNAIELIEKEATIYRLDVEELDVYYANNILTHNK